jgi:CHAT domain-containing protein/tetratricopeptide (TPR) repeat protein
MVRLSAPRLFAAFLIAWALPFGNPPVLYAQNANQIRTANQQIGQLIDLGEYATAVGFAEKVILLAEQALGKDDPETLKAVSNLAEVYKKLGRVAEAELLLKRIIKTNERVLGNDHPDTLASVSRLGMLLRTQARNTEAEPLFKRALESRRRVLGKDHPDTLVSIHNLGELYLAQGKFAEAEPLLKTALDAAERIRGKDHEHTLIMAKTLADIYRQQGRYDEAETLYKRVVETRERVQGNAHSDTAQSLNDLAVIYYEQGRYGAAEPLFTRALDIEERALGKEHTQTLSTLGNLADLYRLQGRYGEAEPLYKRALEARERTEGSEHPSTLNTVSNLAVLYDSQGRFAEAEQLNQRALAARERTLGKEHPDTLHSLNNLATVYASQGRYGEAEQLLKRVLEVSERVLGKEHPNTLVKVNNLGALYEDQGRYGEAETLYQRALESSERVLGEQHPDTFYSAVNLATLYYKQRRHDEAEPLLKRMAELSERVLGEKHPVTLTIVNNLAMLYDSQNRFAEAEPLLKRALAAVEEKLGADNPLTLHNVINLASLYKDLGRYAEAEPLYKRALTAQERVLGKEHSVTLTSLTNLADFRRVQGRDEEAEALFREALATRERVLGKEHPDTLQNLVEVGVMAFRRRDWAEAAAFWRRSSEALIKRSLHGARATDEGLSTKKKTAVEQDSGLPLLLIRAISQLVMDGRENNETALRETFQTAQWALVSEAGQSLANMAARGAKDDPALADLVRERQDMVAEWLKRDALRNTALGQAVEQRNASAEKENIARLMAIEKRVAAIDVKLSASFPDYAALANPEPLSVAGVQAELRADEALILFLDTPDVNQMPGATFLWVVTKTAMRWVRSELAAAALGREVQALRCGLDTAAWEGPACRELTGRTYDPASSSAAQLPFDTARANGLYESLFRGVEDLIKDKHLLLVPSGALMQLPFQVLVSAPPTSNDYRSTAWLARSHAMTVLPAVSSLKALRRVNRPSGASKPLVGFGNPLLDGFDSRYASLAKQAREKQSCSQAALERVALPVGLRRTTASIDTDGVLADPAFIRKQTPLPETADELCAVMRDIGADANDVYLGAQATERHVKALSKGGELARYRIVHFATHGAMAGELKRGIEPGLILTPPNAASEDDDGYLSASEIAALRLDADWVILSACNTAAGNASDADALSGLTRAFIYAHARALLVSHWAVDSNTTAKLITLALRENTRSKTVGKAEALRRAMIALVDRGSVDEAHPAFWAPFVLVGEAATQ